jgi:RimJ/RimL family protein N-acetyltransferase
MPEIPAALRDWLTPVVLENKWIRLEPLSLSHVGGLAEVADDADIWRWLPVVPPKNAAEVKALVQAGIDERQRGGTHPLRGHPQRHRDRDTSYLDLSLEHRSVEIGWTWYGRSARRTTTNTASKRLLLEHASEHFRVAFKTDARNVASNTALRRIGATYEGTLRAHRVLPDGSRRDSAYYSILDTEWPDVRRKLDDMLGGFGSN